MKIGNYEVRISYQNLSHWLSSPLKVYIASEFIYVSSGIEMMDNRKNETPGDLKLDSTIQKVTFYKININFLSLSGSLVFP